MPIVTRNEFAELCGEHLVQAINVWITRGKIIHIEGDKKHIDTENPVNALFLSERQEFNRAKSLGLPPIVSVKLDTKKPKDIVIDTKIAKTVTKLYKNVPKIPKNATEYIEPGVKAPSKKSRADSPEMLHVEHKMTVAQKREEALRMNDQNRRAMIKVDQEAQKRTLEIENLELSKQQKQLFLNKSAGQLMPVDLVRGVLKRHADAINKNFEKGIEAIVTRMVNIMKGNDHILVARFLGEAKEILSKNIATAGKMADEEMVILVDDYSEKLLRGQKRT